LLDVARELLGATLVRRFGSGATARHVAVRIVEVEAYGGAHDRASHSWRGETPRCATMFGPAGRLYVYFTYGSHFCVNVVAGERDGPRATASALLLRAAEAVDGDDAGVALLREARAARCKSAAKRRELLAGRDDARLLSGPGNLAAALALDRSHDGLDLSDATSEVQLRVGPPIARVEWTPRVGLGDYPAASWCWRVAASDRAATTRIPAAWPRRRMAWPTLARAVAFGAAERRALARGLSRRAAP